MEMARVVSKELFPEYRQSENAFLTKKLEGEKCKDLIDALNQQIEMTGENVQFFLLPEEDEGLNRPTEYVMQLYGRNAGFTSKTKPEFYGDECAAIVLKDTQIINFKGEQYVIGDKGTAFMTPIFDITEYEEADSDSSNSQNSPLPEEEREYPIIPRKCTSYIKGDNRATLKPRDYMSIVIWAIWK